MSTIYNDSSLTKNQLDRIRNHEVLTKTLFGTGICGLLLSTLFEFLTSNEAHRSTVWCPMMVEHKSGAKSQVGNHLDENGRLILKWNVTLTRHWLCNCSAFRAKGPRQKKKIWEYSTHSNLSNALSNSLRGIDAVILQRKQVKGHPENNKKMLPKSGSGIHLRNRELFI